MTPDSEDLRLKALHAYGIVDTMPESSFDRITQLAKLVFNVPIVLVTFVTSDRQWFKSCIGMDTTETPREHAFCDITIQQQTPLIIEDALGDPRTANNPLVLGEPHIRFYAGAPLITPEGFGLGSLCVIDHKARCFSAEQSAILTGMAEMVMHELELRRLATRDSLTGANTRRAFDDSAGKAIAHIAETSEKASVIAFDLDHFKKINDSYGHAFGDKVLVRTVDTVKASLRPGETVTRMGGEEFAIILRDTNIVRAREIAERLRHAIATMRFAEVTDGRAISASFGVTEIHHLDTDIAAALERADRALYRAKHEGRNRVCCLRWEADLAGKTAAA